MNKSTNSSNTITVGRREEGPNVENGIGIPGKFALVTRQKTKRCNRSRYVIGNRLSYFVFTTTRSRFVYEVPRDAQKWTRIQGDFNGTLTLVRIIQVPLLHT